MRYSPRAWLGLPGRRLRARQGRAEDQQCRQSQEEVRAVCYLSTYVTAMPPRTPS